MLFSSTSASLAAVAALVLPTSAFFRMECHHRTGLLPMDPIVNPGVKSDHCHAFHGANNVGLSTSYDDLRKSQCTSCLATQDKSAYWTPSMHFRYKNGSTVAVPQSGGMLAYYLFNGDNIKAFPAGFKMIAGDTRQRNYSAPNAGKDVFTWTAADKTQDALRQKSRGINCLNYQRTPEPTLMRQTMPDRQFIDANCANGLRMEQVFGSCWNGKDLDSPSHRDHIAYPDFVDNGVCPPDFPVRLPTLLYETIWETYTFIGTEGEFIMSNGDPTGCGYHADFMSGWEESLLQQAINTCTNLSGKLTDCPLLQLQTEEEADKCNINPPPEVKDSDCPFCNQGMPNDVPVQPGPAYATPNHGGAPAGPSAAAAAPANYGPAPAPPPPAKNYGGEQAQPSPVPTPAPAPDAYQRQADGKLCSTSTYTSAGKVYEMVVEEVVVTVTSTVDSGNGYGQAPAPKYHKRHLHQHKQRHAHA